MNTVGNNDAADFFARLAEVLGLEDLTPDENGLISLSVGNSAPVSCLADTKHHRILCFSEVCVLLPDAPVSVYRDMMAAGLFGSDTAGGWFGLEPESDTVVYHAAYDFDPQEADPRAFAELIGFVADFTRIWRGRIGGMLADAIGLAPANAPTESSPENA